MANLPGIAPVLPAVPDALPALRACLFALAGSGFAIDVRSAREVAVFDEITAVPRAPRYLVGVANLRGTVLPIVDIRGLLGLAETRPARSLRTLVVRDGSLMGAVVVDSVLGLEPFDDVLLADRPAAAARSEVPRQFVAGWLTWAGETVPLLDVPRLLAALRTTERPVEAAQEDPA